MGRCLGVGVDGDIVVGEVEGFVAAVEVGDDCQPGRRVGQELALIEVFVSDQLPQGRQRGMWFDFEDKYLLAAEADGIDTLLCENYRELAILRGKVGWGIDAIAYADIEFERFVFIAMLATEKVEQVAFVRRHVLVLWSVHLSLVFVLRKRYMSVG